MNVGTAWRVCAILAILLITGAILVGCGSSTTTTTAAATTVTTAAATTTTAAATTTTAASGTTTTGAAGGAPIVIGFAIAQSGFGAPFDGPVARMAELAIADINAKGGVLGRQIQTIYGDNKTDPAQSAVVGGELLAKGANVIFCSSNFEVGGPAARAANDKGVVAFGPGCADLKLGVQGVGPLVYNAANSIGTEASILAQFASATKGWKTGHILKDTGLGAAATEATDAFQEVFLKLGGSVTVDTFANSDTSIAAQISKLQAISPAPEFIFLQSMPPGMTMAVKQLRDAGINTPILGPDTMDGDTWFTAIPNLKDVFYVTYVSEFGDDANAAANDVIARYRAKYPEPMTSGIAITGYAAIELLATAIERAGTTDGKAVAAQLDKFTNEASIVGPTTYTPQWHIQFTRPMAIMQLDNGKHTYLGTVAPMIQPTVKL